MKMTCKTAYRQFDDWPFYTGHFHADQTVRTYHQSVDIHEFPEYEAQSEQGKPIKSTLHFNGRSLLARVLQTTHITLQ